MDVIDASGVEWLRHEHRLGFGSHVLSTVLDKAGIVDSEVL